MTTVEQERGARRESGHLASTYDPLPVVLSRGEGARVWDVDGTEYLDFLSGYSALNFGHRHPALVAAAEQQLRSLTLTSRAFMNDRLGPFCDRLAAVAGLELVVPMNTGAEAVETAIKAARRWGYLVKEVAPGTASIVVADGNFHGRTTTIVGFSTDPTARDHFGPFTPGFRVVPFGDAGAVEAAIDPSTVAVLVEPIQGEAGVVIPPAGYLRRIRQTCDRAGVLLVLDEVQSGLGRTGRTFAFEHEGVRPDLLLLGKALGGGIVPVSAVVGTREVLGLLSPGTHGSTFGGNPLAAAVGCAVLDLIDTGELQARSRLLGDRMGRALTGLRGHGVADVRWRGLWAGVDLAPGMPSGQALCEGLAGRGVLAKDAHGRTIRLAPPLVIADDELARGLDAIISAVVEAEVEPAH